MIQLQNRFFAPSVTRNGRPVLCCGRHDRSGLRHPAHGTTAAGRRPEAYVQGECRPCALDRQSIPGIATASHSILAGRGFFLGGKTLGRNLFGAGGSFLFARWKFPFEDHLALGFEHQTGGEGAAFFADEFVDDVGAAMFEELERLVLTDGILAELTGQAGLGFAGFLASDDGLGAAAAATRPGLE